MTSGLTSQAIVFEKPGELVLRTVTLAPAGAADLVVDIEATGISTGTEKLLWDGTMPVFPGLSYPLVPGYEAVGVVRQAGEQCLLASGERVFVPGASCYEEGVRGLFGASASTLVVPEARVTPIAQLPSEQATLLALASTAMHILTCRIRQDVTNKPLHISDVKAHTPQLIVGHGVLGRLLARICIAVGADAPLVWELDSQRREAGVGYDVISPDDDTGTSRQHIVDVSGACGDHFNHLIKHLGKGGRLTLGGFYNDAVNFNFAPAFMREISLDIAAEWTPDDLSLTLGLVQAGILSLDGLVSHQHAFSRAKDAYPMAFNDPACLKMILNWSA